MLELENEVYEKIWRLEHKNGITCEEPGCNLQKEILPHGYWHGQGIEGIVGHGT